MRGEIGYELIIIKFCSSLYCLVIFVAFKK